MPNWKQLIVESFRARALRPPDPFALEEMAQHLEELWHASLGSGLAEEQAMAIAQDEIAHLSAHLSSVCGAQRSDEPNASRLVLAGFAHDLRHAWRLIRAQPAFTGAVVITLALGIGSATAVLSVAVAVLVRPLPFPEPDRLVVLQATNSAGGLGNELSFLDFEDINGDRGAFERAAAALRYSTTLVGGSEPMRIQGYEVTPAFLDVFGVHPALGRSFVSEESGPSQVALISDALWRRALGGDPDVIGRTISLADVPYDVVGVLPSGFWAGFGWDVDVLIPARRSHPLARSRAIRTYQVFARLAPGVSLDVARAALDAKATQLAAAYPETNARRQFSAAPLLDEVAGVVETPLRLVSGVVVVVLLLVCANVSNLLLTRAAWRRREMGVRAALGAGRARLVRQMLTESLMLAVIGGGGGVLVAIWIHRVLVQTQGVTIPRIDSPVGGLLLAFGAGVTLFAGLAIGTVPALLASRPGPHVLRDSRHSPGGSALVVSRGLVVGQTAAALVLVSGAAVLATSLVAVLRTPGGFDPRDGVAMRIALPSSRYPTRAAIASFFERVAEETRRLPAVRRVGVASALPLSGQDTGSSLSVFGRPLAVSELPSVRWQVAAPGYFAAMGIPLLRGRDYGPDDLKGPHLSIVSEMFERQFFPGGSAIGQRIYCGVPSADHSDWHEVIGVVGDVRHRALDLTPDPRVYDLLGQHAMESASLVVRTTEPAAVAQIRSVVRSADPALAISEISTLEDLARRSVAPRQFLMVLVSSGALMALVVAAVGVYGLLAYNVARRRNELGLRLALGAAPDRLVRMVAWEGVRLTMAGCLVGAAAALGLAHILADQVYGTPIVHAIGVTTGAVVFVGVAAASSYLPARRAARVDPLSTLRDA